MTKRRSYDDKFRASAVVMLEAAGYPNSKGALSHVSKHCGVPQSTLKGWYTGQNNPPPTELRAEKKGELIDWINTELDSIFGVLPNKRNDASYRDLVTGIGILVDKRQLLTGKPTESIEYKNNGLTDEQRVDKVVALLKTARTRADGQPIGGDSG